MFNEERKLKFLSEERGSSEYGISIFRSTAEIERKAGKDLCELDAEAIESLFDTHFGFRKRAVNAAIALMQSYVRWCERNGFPISNGVFELTGDQTAKLKRTMLASPLHLESVLNQVFDPVERQTVDCLYRCYLWMAFSGLKDTDALNVRVTDVDLERFVIQCGDKDFDIYQAAVPAFRLSCNATKFVYVHEKPHYETVRDRAPGELLMRGFRGDLKLTTVRPVVKRRFMESGYDLAYNRIKLSGLFYKAYEMERCGFPVDFSAYAMEELNNRKRNFSENYSRKQAVYSIQCDLVADYARWKEAFSVK